jgi:Clostridium epsilon toxin ETX/Bacillus mosquitocidal toxin MTX2
MGARDRFQEGDSNMHYVGDYIYSPSRLYFGALQANGEFNIYQGESPDDPAKNKVWSTNSGRSWPADSSLDGIVLRKGPFDHSRKTLQIFADDQHLISIWNSGGSTDLTNEVVGLLGDDGKLSLQQNGNEVWSTGFSDPVAEYIVDTIEYDIPRAKINADAPQGTLEQELENNGDLEQEMHMTKKTSTTLTSSWSNATGFKATVSGTVTGGVPGVSSASVTMSAEFSNTFTFGESTSKAVDIGFDFTLKVPPKKKYKGTAEINKAKFEVPYTVFGELHFKSGKKIKHKLSGTYHGKCGYLGIYRVDDVTAGAPKMVLMKYI